MAGFRGGPIRPLLRAEAIDSELHASANEFGRVGRAVPEGCQFWNRTGSSVPNREAGPFGVAEVRPAEVHPQDARFLIMILFSPQIPRIHAMLQNRWQRRQLSTAGRPLRVRI